MKAIDNMLYSACNDLSDSCRGILETSGIIFLLGMSVSVLAYKNLSDFLEKTITPKRYSEREARSKKIVEDYISALKESSCKIRQKEEHRHFSGYFSNN